MSKCETNVFFVVFFAINILLNFSSAFQSVIIIEADVVKIIRLPSVFLKVATTKNKSMTFIHSFSP